MQLQQIPENCVVQNIKEYICKMQHMLQKTIQYCILYVFE